MATRSKPGQKMEAAVRRLNTELGSKPGMDMAFLLEAVVSRGPGSGMRSSLRQALYATQARVLVVNKSIRIVDLSE